MGGTYSSRLKLCSNVFILLPVACGAAILLMELVALPVCVSSRSKMVEPIPADICNVSYSVFTLGDVNGLYSMGGARPT